MDNAVLPFLRQRFNLTGLIKSRELKISGTGESMVDERIGELEKLANPTVGLNAKSGVIIVRITASAQNETEADKLIAGVERTARDRLGDWVFGADADTLEGVVLAKLAERGQTLAVIETGTGGRLAGKLAEADKGRGVFRGGQVKASSEVSDDIESVARSAAHASNASWGVACTIQTEGKDMAVTVGVWSASKTHHWQRGFGSHPGLAPEWAANMALDTVRRTLK